MEVYKITNKVNNKIYIGQTTRLISDRWKEHCCPSSDYCRLLHKAIKKYGKDNFQIESIYKAKTIEELNQQEEALIKNFNALKPHGYNLLPGGLNRRHHPATKAQMSKTRTGKKVPKLCVPRGPMSLETRLKISAAKKGRPNGLLGKKRPGILHLAARKPVRGEDSAGNVIEFGSLKEASAFFNKSHTNLVAHLNGRRPSWCKYKWCYLRSKRK